MKIRLAYFTLAQFFSGIMACYDVDSQLGNTDDVDLHMFSVPDDPNACLRPSDPLNPPFPDIVPGLIGHPDDEGTSFDTVGISKRDVTKRRNGRTDPGPDVDEMDAQPSDEEIYRQVDQFIEFNTHVHVD
ncbi:hypothetical protein H0H93_012996 [Arthromyces matolae]|nr:hypothetical protein H0H93_012996 [Arthromyces matolae]